MFLFFYVRMNMYTIVKHILNSVATIFFLLDEMFYLKLIFIPTNFFCTFFSSHSMTLVSLGSFSIPLLCAKL